MRSTKTKPQTIDEYVGTFPNDVRVILEKVRQTIRKTVPPAEETISYQIPTFKLDGKYLVYFAGWKKHVSLYPIPKGNRAFKEEIFPYVTGKATVRFPIDKPLPLSLIQKIVKYRVKENLRRMRRKNNT